MSEQVLYEKKEVYIHEKIHKNEEQVEINKIGGCLQIIKNKYGTFIRFLPYGCDMNVSDDWALIVNNSVQTYSRDQKDDTESVTLDSKSQSNSKYKMQFDLNELRTVRRVYQGASYEIPYLVFMLHDGRTWPYIYFHKGGSKEFLQELKQFFLFKKNAADPRLWTVERHNGERFKQSLYELSLFNEQREHVTKKFLNEPLQSTLLGFSKVTNMFRDALRMHDGAAGAANNQTAKNMPVSNSDFETSLRKMNRSDSAHLGADDMSDLMDSLTADNIHSTINDGYEMVTKVDLGPMPEVFRGLPVTKSSIKFDKEGRIQDVELLKERIFRGGLENNELRVEIWKYLLNYYEWTFTHEAKIQKRKQRVDDYFRMKLQWKTISDEQKAKFTLMKERENLIEKDVQRTDRNNPYFENDDNPNLATMKDILMTYNMYNFDLGYVQGMSDLLAPIMVIMDNEVDSFWSFAGFMDKLESNFQMDQLNIKLQLSNLKAVLEFVDSKFSDYLEKNDSSNMYFCFRWILILFKREFSFPDIMRLWEVLLTDLPCKNFHLLICISILLMKKDDIIANKYGFNEILKFINELSYRIDLNKTLEYAEGLYIQIRNFKNLPTNICEMFGFPVLNKNKDDVDLDDRDDTFRLSTRSASSTFDNNSRPRGDVAASSSAQTGRSPVGMAASKSSGSIGNKRDSSFSAFKKDEDSIEILN